jgi:dihydroneopterin aldolase
MSTSSLHSNLVLPGIRSHAHIGLSDEERAIAQWVVVDLALDFTSPPTATHTDRIDDTVDYAALTATVVKVCSARPYALLERLAHALYVELRETFSPETGLWLEASKLRAPLAELEHGARFGLGDWQGGASVTSARRVSVTSRFAPWLKPSCPCICAATTSR